MHPNRPHFEPDANVHEAQSGRLPNTPFEDMIRNGRAELPAPQRELVSDLSPRSDNGLHRSVTGPSNSVPVGAVVGVVVGLIIVLFVLLPILGPKSTPSAATTNANTQSAAPVAYATPVTPTATPIPTFPMPSSDIMFRTIADGYTSTTYSYFIQSIVGIVPLKTNNPQPYSAEYCVAYNWNNTFSQGTDVKIFSLQFDPTTHAYSASSQSDYSNSCGSASDISNNPGVIHIQTPTAPIPSSATMESLIASYNATQVNQISITLTAGYYLYTCGSEGQVGIPTQGLDYIFYYDQQGQWRVVSSGAVGC